ncbi:MAG: DNA translocase FtsK [Chloroflexi bacterium]|nr:DNA translocase FtsK [Chloroflexota bacterium]
MGTKAPRRTKARKTTHSKSPSIFKQREFWAVTLMIISVITLIALLFSGQGLLGDGWAAALRQIFGGFGAFVMALLWLSASIALLAWESVEPRFHPRWQSVLGWSLTFLCFTGFLHIASKGDPLALARSGRGGGHIGWLIWQLINPLFGRAASLVLLAIAIILSVLLAIGASWRDTAAFFQKAAANVYNWLKQLVQQLKTLFLPSVTRTTVSVKPFTDVSQPQPPITHKPTPLKSPNQPRPGPEPPELKVNRPAAKPRPAAAKGLPSLDLLSPDQGVDTDDRDARARAETIEKTLKSFGIPASVVEWHRGPVVTQFGVEPGYTERPDRYGNVQQLKVRVSKILALSNDLALALAAAPIRIEAPVPGRGVVGIEVPNGTKALVGLRSVLESEQFAKAKGILRIALGRDVSGQAVVTDLAAMPHLLVAGATGSGKSACLNAIIASLLFFNQPEQVKLLLVDPKRVELTNYNGIPHLIAPVVVDTEKVIIALRWVTREMERRYTTFASLGVRDITSYNKLAATQELETLPMIVVIIDELADMMLAAPDDVEQTLCRIAQMARATGIHLVIATQRPSVDVVTGLIKANFPARISFLVTSQVDSRVILDAPGAEKLLGRGDMLFMAPDSPKLERIQGCYVFDKELEALVAFWRHVKVQQMLQPEEQVAPWEGMSADEGDADDALLDQAATLVREHNQASASFLQRQMRIGYPRAARLIDQLQEIGVVGPPEVGGRSRTVLPDAQTEVRPESTDEIDDASTIDSESDS